MKKERKLSRFERERLEELEKLLNRYSEKYPDINNSLLYGDLSSLLLETIKEVHEREIEKVTGLIDVSILEEDEWKKANADKDGYIPQNIAFISTSTVITLTVLKKVIKSWHNILD